MNWIKKYKQPMNGLKNNQFYCSTRQGVKEIKMNDLYKNYDEKEHAKCLLKILEKNNPCSHCQLGYANDYNLWKIDSYSECELIPFYVHCCSICHVFINMDKITGE